MQVVEALEALAERRLHKGLHLSRLRVQNEDSTPVIRDEDPAVTVDLEAVRPAVVLRGELPLLFGTDPENSSKRDVDAPKVPLAVERRPLEEAVERDPRAVRVRPGGAPLLAELRRKRREAAGLASPDVLERVQHWNAAKDKG